MSSYHPERLAVIMQEEGNLGLFSAEVRRAYASGPDGPPKARAQLARELLADPAQKAPRIRWFTKKWVWAAPVDDAPRSTMMLGTGIGYGGDIEMAPDGSAVANRWVKVLGVPVFPLGAFLIRRGDPVEVLGKVPFDSQWYAVPAVLLWLLSMPFVLLYAAAVDAAYVPSGTFYVVNGFEAPLRVVLEGEETMVPPGGRAYVSTETVGAHEVEVFLGDLSIETRTLDVPRSYTDEDILLYNPGARAVLVQAENRYGNGPAPAAPKVLVGTEIRTDKPDDFFTEPTELVFTKEGSVVRIHLAMLWPSASPEERAAGLVQEGFTEEAAVYGEALLSAGNDHPAVLLAASAGSDVGTLCGSWTSRFPHSANVSAFCGGRGQSL